MLSCTWGNEMKGYIKMLVAFIMILVIFFVVDFFLASRLYTECEVSDAVALSYKMTNAVEFTKLNAKQALEFSINKTVGNLNITNMTDLITNNTLRQQFLDELNETFNPSMLDRIDMDIDITVSLDVDTTNSRILARLEIVVRSLHRTAKTDTEIYQNF